MLYHTNYKENHRKIIQLMVRKTAGGEISWDESGTALDYYMARYPHMAKRGYIQHYLKDLIPQVTIKSTCIGLMCFDEMKEYELETTPFCNAQTGLGLLPLFSWTGKCDGDTWVIDTHRSEICSVSLEGNVDTYEELDRFIYHRFYSVTDWLTYLIGSIHYPEYDQILA